MFQLSMSRFHAILVNRFKVMIDFINNKLNLSFKLDFKSLCRNVLKNGCQSMKRMIFFSNNLEITNSCARET